MTATADRSARSDADLVAASLRGDRTAFGQIVARYQALLCAIGYSATGCMSRSEDLAQEAFLSAWRGLRDLKDPSSLRAWLCTIVRNRAHNVRRADGAEPVAAAEPIEAIETAPAAEPEPVERAISAEEQALLWRALERLDGTYREPLVLYYRQQRSVEQVAAELELTVDTAKQRLSRGRRLLEAQVLAFVEGALERSGPGSAFTVAVVSALPHVLSATAVAASGAGAAKGSVGAKIAALGASLSGVLGPAIGVLNGVFVTRVVVGAQLDATRTPEERERVLRQTRGIVLNVVAFLAPFTPFLLLGPWWIAHPVLLPVVGVALAVGFAASFAVLVARYTHELRVLRRAERARAPQRFEAEDRVGRDYRSRLTLFGLPLLHVRYGIPDPDAGPARGWIAIGDRAVGVIALGATASGGIAVGAVAYGVVAVGSISVGLVSLGTIAFGGLTLGALGVGAWAYGGGALAWIAAVGGLAWSHDVAFGRNAVGAHANDAVALQFLNQYHAEDVFLALFALLVVLSVVPTLGYAWLQRRQRRRVDSLSHP